MPVPRRGRGAGEVIARASSGARIVLEPAGDVGRHLDARRVRVVSAQGIGTRLSFQDVRELAAELAKWLGRNAAGP